MVIDKNGVRLEVGQKVLVHTEDAVKKAVVIKLFPNNPTVKAPGHWVDIDTGEGVEGMPSYLLEVVDK